MISFRPSASFSESFPASSNTLEEHYLPSGVPTSINLLESIKDEPALKGVVPRLPALRLTRVNIIDSDPPPTERAPSVRPQPDFRVIPAITAKVRYSRVNGITGKLTIVASIDIETGTFFDHDVHIDSVQMRLLSEGSSEVLCQGIASMLPMTCRPGDNLTFLFRLVGSEPLPDVASPNLNSRTLDISIDANVLTNASCRPRIKMRWSAGVDFSATLNPTFNFPAQPLQRSKRPTSITLSHALSRETGMPGSSQGLHSLGAYRRERAVSVNELGVSVTFTGPNDIFVGEPFCWDIFVVNRSSKPRKLAIAVIPKFNNGDMRTHLSEPSYSSTRGRRDATIAEAVIEENLLYTMQKSASKDAVQIVSLSNELKIG